MSLIVDRQMFKLEIGLKKKNFHAGPVVSVDEFAFTDFTKRKKKLKNNAFYFYFSLCNKFKISVR